jgi:hypothetical protein
VRSILYVICSLWLGFSEPAEAAKAKHKQKQKAFHPVAIVDARDVVGHYVGVDSVDLIEIKVDADGQLAILIRTSTSATALRDISLEGSAIEGAVVAPDGSSETFTATFVDRELNGVCAFGLLVNRSLRIFEETGLDRVFYRRR